METTTAWRPSNKNLRLFRLTQEGGHVTHSWALNQEAAEYGRRAYVGRWSLRFLSVEDVTL